MQFPIIASIIAIIIYYVCAIGALYIVILHLNDVIKKGMTHVATIYKAYM